MHGSKYFSMIIFFRNPTIISASNPDEKVDIKLIQNELSRSAR